MTPVVIRMTIVSDATTWSITYDRHSDDRNMLIKHYTSLFITRSLQDITSILDKCNVIFIVESSMH